MNRPRTATPIPAVLAAAPPVNPDGGDDVVDDGPTGTLVALVAVVAAEVIKLDGATVLAVTVVPLA
jgi:hypothetical protein